MDDIQQAFGDFPDQFLVSLHPARVQILGNFSGERLPDARDFRQPVFLADDLNIFRKPGNRLRGLEIRPRLENDLSLDLQERPHPFQNVGDFFVTHTVFFKMPPG